MKKHKEVGIKNKAIAPVADRAVDGSATAKPFFPMKWATIERYQKPMFEKWHHGVFWRINGIGPEFRAAAWRVALRQNQFEIEGGESERALSAVTSTFEPRNDTYELFEFWCAAIKYARIVEAGAAVFGDRSAAIDWLYTKSHRKLMSGARPIDLLLEYFTVVEQSLAQIECARKKS
jgi:hypothetical protein